MQTYSGLFLSLNCSYFRLRNSSDLCDDPYIYEKLRVTLTAVIRCKEKTTYFHYSIKYDSAPIEKHKLTCLLIFYFSCINITMVWGLLRYRNRCSCIVYVVYCSRSNNKKNIHHRDTVAISDRNHHMVYGSTVVQPFTYFTTN